LVARENDGTIGGFAIMKFGDERAHLVLLAVLPKRRRRGIARRLLTWLVESARTAGVMSIHVELRAGNQPAHRLYRTLDFVETFHIPRYYQGRETAVRMIRMLRAPNIVAEPWRPPTLDKR
jgi:ribosomal-protein-alanine N-acetyltransferase